MYKELLKEMFHEMVLKKNASLIPHYYDEDFLLYTNEQEMNYETYLKLHEELYATPIEYMVEYDEERFVEEGEKLAGRMWITVTKPDQPARRLEVILICEYKGKKLYRLHELTFPDWSQEKHFDL
ncbi:MAG: hypothetical protein S4CHLAM102_16480 [Chlamydiia bacterium]|nr:hypothetical protein [Chlamydiia bacterium]